MRQIIIGFVICLALTLLWHFDRTSRYHAGVRAGKAEVQARWEMDRLARSEAARLDALERAKISNDVQGKYDAEVNKLRADLRRSERLRVGTAICGTAETTPDSASGDSAGTRGRILSEEMDRDIKSLIQETELVAATARACQGVLLK